MEVTKLLARQYRMPAVDLSRFEVDPKILKLIPPDMATKRMVLPLKREGRTLTVAMADPTDHGLLEDLKFITRYDLFPVIAGEFTLRTLIEKHYANDQQELQSLLKDMEATGEDVEVVEEAEEEVATQAQIDDAPVVKLINGILTDAVKRGASDIHIEPFEHEIRVRYRIDGALLEVMQPPLKMKAALTSRIKILAPAQHRRAPGAPGRPPQAQDGQPRHRLPRLDPAGALRREDRAPNSRQGQPDARPHQVRVRAQGREGPDEGDPESLRHGAGDRPDRIGQDDDALLRAVRGSTRPKSTS